MNHLLVNIGFMPVSAWDVLDVAIVTYLLYELYKLVRGSVASNILTGIGLLFLLYFAVDLVGMQLLSALLDRFVSVGVIVLVIIFQPELRRFLLLLGNNALRQRSNVVQRLLRAGIRSQQGSDEEGEGQGHSMELIALKAALLRLARKKTGALIVVSDNPAGEPTGSSGTKLDADLTESLLLSIFNKHSPLHDGAVIVHAGRIYAASCVLPVTDRTDLPQSVGLRHRAAVGLSERSKSKAFVVSEETGGISVASGGRLRRKLKEEQLEQELLRALG